MGIGLLSSIAGLFGGAGEIGTTPVEQGVGYSPEIPMSTGVDTGFNVPAQPTDASGGISPSFWQQLTSFLGMDGGTNSSVDDGSQVDASGKKTGKKSELNAFGKFLTASSGLQSTLQNSRLAQQMVDQHMSVNRPQQQGQYQAPINMATILLQRAGLL